MFHITCELPNASTEINGIAFETVVTGEGEDAVNVVQTIDPVDEAMAAQFRGIPGYTIEPADGAKPAAETKADAPADGSRRGRGRPSNAELAARRAVQEPAPAAPAADASPELAPADPPAAEAAPTEVSFEPASPVESPTAAE